MLPALAWSWVICLKTIIRGCCARRRGEEKRTMARPSSRHPLPSRGTPGHRTRGTRTLRRCPTIAHRRCSLLHSSASVPRLRDSEPRRTVRIEVLVVGLRSSQDGLDEVVVVVRGSDHVFVRERRERRASAPADCRERESARGRLSERRRAQSTLFGSGQNWDFMFSIAFWAMPLSSSKDLLTDTCCKS